MAYATNTSVPVERSKAEIETIIRRYGATGFVSGWNADRAQIVFEIHGMRVRFVLPLPDPKDPVFRKTPTGRTRKSGDLAAAAWEQACRQRWRALTLCIKAKLEAVEAGITSFSEEFLAHIVGPNNQTVGDIVMPSLSDWVSTKKMLPLLPGPK